MGDFTLIGLDEVVSRLQEKLGPERIKTVSNKALRNIATEAIEPDLKAMAITFRRTGATVAQTVVGNVSWADYNIPRIKIGWRKAGGSESPRWNIEHLNEFGFTVDGKSIRPKGFGKMQELIDNYEELYPALVQEELQELFR